MGNLKNSVGIHLPVIRISAALVLLTACLLLSADLLGLAPDESKYLLDVRKQFSETLAIQFSTFAPGQDPKSIHHTLTYIVKRNPEIESAGIRLQNGKLIFQVGDHINKWRNYDKGKSTSTHVVVPLLKNNEAWGDIEIKFMPLRGISSSIIHRSSFKLGGFVLIIGFFVYFVFMLRTLRVLDPTSIIPDRVNAAFDTLTEGIVILDEHEQIVLANKAFTEKMSRPAALLMGAKFSTLHWKSTKSNFPGTVFPWQNVLKTGKNSLGMQLMLASYDDKTFKFIINVSAIQSGNSVTQGVLITLDDVTELEERNTALQTMVSRLQETQAQVQQQNIELNYLATRDSLTGCLNRRRFTELFDKAFKEAQQNNSELSCIMADIDHFKAVNDNYGHAVGDIVIIMLAEILQSNTRKVDLVGRYGGEEFCLVLPGLTVEEAFVVAERIRLRLKDESANRFENGPRVTASFGVSSIKDNPANPSELNNFADEALYVAKESGRNLVICWQPKAEIVRPAQENIQNREKDKIVEVDSIMILQQKVYELESIASKISTELEYTKHYDAITGLPNNILFYDRISQVIERGYRYDQLAAIIVIDIGMLSQVNTTLGRESGDKLVLEIAERLKITLRKYDAISRLTVSRFGGDEFAVLLTNLATKEAVTWIVNRLQEALAEPVIIEDNSVFLASNVGISLYPSDANNVDDLIKNAMVAKKHSKQFNLGTHFQFFDANMQKLSLKHVSLDNELRLAIKNDEWELLYQPKIDIKSSAIMGVEALIRWKHPTRGLLSPFEFIEFAEQRGLIVAIGDWVIKAACLQLKAWAALGLNDIKIAVNISAVQLRQEDFATKILHALDTVGIPPHQLELEVTESTLMDNFKTTLTLLQRLHSRGINIAIDDFGTGYSSLSYLKNLPIGTLKIDRAFIKDICSDEKDKIIVNAMINMAHSMDIIVVAEGVEEQNQFDLLAELSCDEIQGYFISKPKPANELIDMLIGV
jgi:diguanylate cyclase (GGDEF)-like protein